MIPPDCSAPELLRMARTCGMEPRPAGEILVLEPEEARAKAPPDLLAAIRRQQYEIIRRLAREVTMEISAMIAHVQEVCAFIVPHTEATIEAEARLELASKRYELGEIKRPDVTAAIAHLRDTWIAEAEHHRQHRQADALVNVPTHDEIDDDFA